MKISRLRQIQIVLLSVVVLSLVIVAYTDYKIQNLIEEKRFLAPTQYFSSPKKYFVGQVRSLSQFKSYFLGKNYRQRDFGSSIAVGDFSMGDKQQCRSILTQNNNVFACLFFRPRYSKTLYLINLDELDQILSIFSGEDLKPSVYAQAEAESFAQYLGDKPTQQKKVLLGDIPRYCLDAVLAIEDPDFLEHSGVSLRGIFRAFLANIQNIQWSQGGSTITQQLVKNYFLTPEKTISRKLKEILMSLIFEFRVSKDDILETYLNIIYLGQNGVFEVRGYGSASEFYFQKPIDRLNLGECALLAAVVNSPGRYSPVRHPERAKQRRTRVLDKMVEHHLISQEEHDLANETALPTSLSKQSVASAPYYVDAVNKKMKEFGIVDRSGLKVYTALDPQAQRLAEQAVRESLENFENNYPRVKKIKEEKKIHLEAAHLASNPITGEVVAIVGGRNFSTSPYNRAVESQRQVGSIFKPIVYLTALQGSDTSGANYTPFTPINNAPFKLEYEGQTWEPKNYDLSFSGPVPLFYALKESLNIPTARLAMDAGLENVIDTARDLGVESELKKYPSISLGAFELNPLEVLRAYNTISQFGLRQELQIVKQVSNQRGDILYTHENSPEQVGDPADYAVLVGMMMETLSSGTAAYTRNMGFSYFAAGKTGTTSDTKDAWFAGFTPFHTAVTWVGYDDGTAHGLTGASGALPIWTQYMRAISKSYANHNFPWPPSVYEDSFSAENLLDFGIKADKARDTKLIIKNE